MLRFLYIFCIFVSFLNSANLLKTSVYESELKFDLLLLLDRSFNGEITHKEEGLNHYYIITDIDTKKAKEVAKVNDYIRFARVFPEENGLKLHIRLKKPLDIEVTKSPDNYGIRFRISQKTQNKIETFKTLQSHQIDDIVVEKKDLSTSIFELDNRYLFIIFFTGILLLFLIFFQLFRSKILFLSKENNSIEVQTKKILDKNSKVLEIIYKDYVYLVFIGSTNFLIDKYPLGENKTFNYKLQKKREEIEKIFDAEDRKLKTFKKKMEN